LDITILVSIFYGNRLSWMNMKFVVLVSTLSILHSCTWSSRLHFSSMEYTNCTLYVFFSWTVELWNASFAYWLLMDWTGEANPIPISSPERAKNATILSLYNTVVYSWERIIANRKWYTRWRDIFQWWILSFVLSSTAGTVDAESKSRNTVPTSSYVITIDTRVCWLSPCFSPSSGTGPGVDSLDSPMCIQILVGVVILP
jgi:hypothetical protein